ncbi:cytoplasmic protein [Cryptococcus deuterogattii 2001/935-1]|nr:cytoplasmic protein [Cryptococcus deuterogattii 2001/935-1]
MAASLPQDAPNPNAPTFRPSPTRAITLGGTPFQYKTRAASQPAGERFPIYSNPSSGRGTPGGNGGGNGNDNGGTNGTANGNGYGVIGGTRGGGRFGNALAGGGGGGPATRASSFSAGERHEPRSTSPFPTFSPTSTPSTSPAALRQHPLPHSPPKAANSVSRSRSQSLATGGRPSTMDRPWMGPLTKPDVGNVETWGSPEPSNMSPFTRGLSSLAGGGGGGGGGNTLPEHARRFQDPTYTLARAAWADPHTQSTQSALTSSVAKALGGYPTHSLGLGYNDPSPGAGGGSRSGTSSRRHSVSVVGGPGGRRELVFAEAGGMTPLGSTGFGAFSPRGGLFGFENDLGNALNLDIDLGRETKKRQDTFHQGSLPKFEFDGGMPGTRGAWDEAAFPSFGTPARGRVALPSSGGNQPAQTQPQQFHIQHERAPSTEESRRFPQASFDMPPPPLAIRRSSIQAAGATGATGLISMSQGPLGPVGTGIPRNIPTISNMSMGPGPGPIGSPPTHSNLGMPPSFGGSLSGNAPAAAPIRQPYQNPTAPGAIQQGFRPQYGYFSGQPLQPQQSQQQQQQQQQQQVRSGLGQIPLQPGVGGYNKPINIQPPPNQPYAFSPSSSPAFTQPPPQLSSQPPAAIHAPASPSFSSLSLSDLGKGLPLSSLPPTTPLYIVTFKAGRRDVYYCPDPTLLISNGDLVIVEADRGSDLGTIVCDQLTPVEIREWQERQATKALLSGAREHQPPGMAVGGAAGAGVGVGVGVGAGTQGGGGENAVAAGGILGHTRNPSGSAPSGQPQQQQPQQQPQQQQQQQQQMQSPQPFLQGMELASLDIDSLLAGVGPGGQMEVVGTAVRGPLAKEIMPKRIFAKSSQGAEEQQRMREKIQDEYDAMMICREKVAQRGLPMQIVDAEYQWDRRKLTFYFKADKRVDFRDLTKENFRIFKSRIWMSMVSKDDPRS